MCWSLRIRLPATRSPAPCFYVLTIVSMAGFFVLLQTPFSGGGQQMLVWRFAAGHGAVPHLPSSCCWICKEVRNGGESRLSTRPACWHRGAATVSIAVAHDIHRHPAIQCWRPAWTLPRSKAPPLRLGKNLFAQYALPFELVSLLLGAVAMRSGPLLLSKCTLKMNSSWACNITW